MKSEAEQRQRSAAKSCSSLWAALSPPNLLIQVEQSMGEHIETRDKSRTRLEQRDMREARTGSEAAKSGRVPLLLLRACAATCACSLVLCVLTAS